MNPLTSVCIRVLPNDSEAYLENMEANRMTEADKKHKGHDEFKEHPAKKIRPGRGKFGRMGGFSPSGHKHPGKGRAR